MSVLRNLESKIAGLVEGTFGRVFRSEVRPQELARKLAKEMDEHRTISLSRTYVPNEYVIWLSPQDREKYAGVEHEVGDELGAYLLEHAREERYALVARPQITFEQDDALGLGEFGIQARTVRPQSDPDDLVPDLARTTPGTRRPPAEPAAPPVVQGERGRTMVYSSAERVQEDLSSTRTARRGRAFVVAEGKRMPVGPAGGVIGRSRECDVVLGDSNVSRRHAEIRPVAGGWEITDLGSTNGVRVNGRPAVGATAVQPGDRLELGTVPATFEVG